MVNPGSNHPGESLEAPALRSQPLPLPADGFVGDPFQGGLLNGQVGSSLSPPQCAFEAVFSKQPWVLMLALM